MPVGLPEHVVVRDDSHLSLLVQLALLHEAHHGEQVLLERRPANQHAAYRS